MKRVTGIGFETPSNDNYIGLDSLSSLSDTDIAILSLNLSKTSYSSYKSTSFVSELQYEGKKLYNKESSAKILDHSKHWKSELLHFVENGGTLVIILTPKESFFIYNGSKAVSGTGRNQQVTEHVTPFSNYNFLPFNNIEYLSASGKIVVPSNSIISDFYKNFKDQLHFDVYIKTENNFNPILTTKNKDRTLGGILEIKKGYVIFLPNINIDFNKLTTYNTKKDQNFWNAEGVKFGKIFTNSLVSLESSLRNAQVQTPKPSWLESKIYSIKESEKTIKFIEENNIEIEKKSQENINLYKVLAEQESLKDLLFESGKPLEQAVTEALKILGYKAENYDDGKLELDQVIISPEGHRIIGECEGKDNKDIDVTKFRQLFDSLNADFERDEIQEKAFGILFGNPQRLLNPEERTLSFTDKCQSGAKREKIGLIRTEDLFVVSRYIAESGDEDFAKQCRNEIINQLGQIIKFPDIK